MEKSRFRQVKRWFDRETFPCKECGASDDGTNDSAIEWDDHRRKFICKLCSHVFTEENEYKELLEVTEELQYGFYLKFLSCHFNPCDKCEDVLHKMFIRTDRNNFALDDQNCINMAYFNKGWKFTLGFFSPNRRILNPCSKCQKVLDKLFDNKELHIGNRVEPPVELWRKWEINF